MFICVAHGKTQFNHSKRCNFINSKMPENFAEDSFSIKLTKICRKNQALTPGCDVTYVELKTLHLQSQVKTYQNETKLCKRVFKNIKSGIKSRLTFFLQITFKKMNSKI